MFTHKVDPLAQKQIDELRKDYTDLAANLKAVIAEYAALRGDLEAIEQKLDELLKAKDTSARSIPGEESKPEPLNAMPGHIPWSQRKHQREQASRSPGFIEKVAKSAATTEKPESKDE